MNTSYNTSMVAWLARHAGLVANATHGLTTADGRPVNPSGLDWYVQGAYGFEVPESEAEAVIEYGRQTGLLHQRIGAAVATFADAARILDGEPGMINKVKLAQLRTRGVA